MFSYVTPQNTVGYVSYELSYVTDKSTKFTTVALCRRGPGLTRVETGRGSRSACRVGS